jgi:hypothetical protein
MRFIRGLVFPLISGVTLGSPCIAPAYAQVDLAGEWTVRMHEDQPERGPGPSVGDYTGIPVNAAGRQSAERWDASILTVPEMQCIPHPANYSALHSNLRIWKEVDVPSQRTTAWRLLWESYNRFRTVHMDDTPRPGPDEMHTWQGFSTGSWQGRTLRVYTTNMKAERIRRNGVIHSDQAELVEYFARYNDVLTLISVLNDPVYLTEPYIHERSFVYNPQQVINPYPCRGVVEILRPSGVVPNWLPGKNPILHDWADTYGIPREAALGGAQFNRPEYVIELNKMRNNPPRQGN